MYLFSPFFPLFFLFFSQLSLYFFSLFVVDSVFLGGHVCLGGGGCIFLVGGSLGRDVMCLYCIYIVFYVFIFIVRVCVCVRACVCVCICGLDLCK